MTMQLYKWEDGDGRPSTYLFDWGRVPNGRIRIEIGDSFTQLCLCLTDEQAERLISVLSAHLRKEEEPTATVTTDYNEA